MTSSGGPATFSRTRVNPASFATSPETATATRPWVRRPAMPRPSKGMATVRPGAAPPEVTMPGLLGMPGASFPELRILPISRTSDASRSGDTVAPQQHECYYFQPGWSGLSSSSDRPRASPPGRWQWRCRPNAIIMNQQAIVFVGHTKLCILRLWLMPSLSSFGAVPWKTCAPSR